MFFGIWLLFGLLPKLTWLATTALFLLFALVSFYKAISGETSCGCFGNVTVNSWFTMTFDIFIVFLETGGYTQNELRTTFDDGIGHWGCLKPVHHWFIETPVMFKLRDGVVEEVDTYK
ncbi:hypothetical protein FACS189419_06450 [Planctomycetales bacterium]|nr:hypothetical protein FACS189419_06450 [Planctomycetales bacterium]